MIARVGLLTVVFGLVLTGTARAAPVITPTITGTPGSNGWYTSAVTLSWTVNDTNGGGITSTSSGCVVTTFSADAPSVTQTCTATSADGSSASVTTPPIKIDRTPPTRISAATTRPADHVPWFTSPVGIAFSGQDALSGIASCTTANYAGPDAPSAAVSGTCRDAAGNTSAPYTFSLAYDATPPTLTDVTASPGDTTASLSWKPSADTQSVSVVASADVPGAARRTVYQGPGTAFLDTGLSNGVGYTYTVTAFDAAGNAASQTASATPFSKLVSPRPNARINAAHARSKPPRLTWHAKAGATYYNVQLFRRYHGHWRKVMSRWPQKNQLQLPAAWSYRGKAWRLDAAHYRWYVWPGYGDQRLRRYGKLLGKRDFFITASTSGVASRRDPGTDG